MDEDDEEVVASASIEYAGGAVGRETASVQYL